MTIDELAKEMQTRGILCLSIRVPGKAGSADPRDGKNDKWLVSSRTTEMQLIWDKGKPKDTLQDAVNTCLGITPATDLSELLG
jgi:hypothetical protein